ncbi:hypothetical protein [Pseudoalteromonas phage KB12-38]|nr:hypothetical protein [Pseudoalteromonas phage KB12-38]
MKVTAPQLSPIFFTHVEQQRIQHNVLKAAVQHEITRMTSLHQSLKERTLVHMGDIDTNVIVDSWLANIEEQFRIKCEQHADNTDLYLNNGDSVSYNWSDTQVDQVHTLVEDGDDRRPLYDLGPKLLTILRLENLFGQPDTLYWLKSLRNSTGALYESTGVHIMVNLELNCDDGDNHQLFTPIRVDWAADKCLWATLQLANHYYLEVEGINARIAQLQGLLNSSQEMQDLLSRIPNPSSPGSEPITFEDGSSF